MIMRNIYNFSLIIFLQEITDIKHNGIDRFFGDENHPVSMSDPMLSSLSPWFELSSYSSTSTSSPTSSSYSDCSSSDILDMSL